MKTKFLLGILLTAILLSMVAVSAAENFTVSTPATFGKSVSSTVMKVKNLVNDSLTLTFDSSVTIEGKEVEGEPRDSISFEITGDDVVGLEKDQTAELTVSITDGPTNWNNFDLAQQYFKEIDFVNSEIPEELQTVKFSVVKTFCEIGSFGDLEITELKDKEIDNEDEWDWAPLDDVEFKVELRNNFDEKKRFKIEYEIYDNRGNTVDFDNDDNDESISLDDGKSQDVTFSLRVPADIEEGNYKLFVKAYVKGHEDDVGCTDSSTNPEVFNRVYYQDISIIKEDGRAVIVDMDKLDTPDFLVCEDFATITAKIYNIGGDEEDEEKVLVNLYSTELGIDLYNTITDLSDGDSSVASFNFEVPEDVEAGLYHFKFINYYEYDSDKGDSDDIRAYESNSKDDLDENFDFSLRVNCVREKEKSASITADPDQEYEAIAGQEVTLNLEIENIGEESADFEIEIEDFESWAEESKIVPRSVTLDSEQTQEVSISLDVDKDAEEGWQTFKIVVLSDNEVVAEKEIELYVEKSSSAGITGSVIADNLRDNWFIWVIVIINVILIIAIILVARRIATAR